MDPADAEWMAQFADTSDRSLAPPDMPQSRVPTTAYTRMDESDEVRGRARHKAGERPWHRDHSDDMDERDIDGLLGIHMDLDASSADERRRNTTKRPPPPAPPKRSLTADLRAMLMQPGTRVVSGNMAKNPPPPPTVAQSLKRKRDDDGDNSASESGDGPHPIPLAEKFEQCLKEYRGRTYEPVETSEEDASSGDREVRARRSKKECFLCAWGDRFHDGIEAPAVNRLHAIFESGYGKIENAALAQMLHLFFKKRIFVAGSGMEMLTQEIALEHIENMHTLDPRIMVGELIRRYMRMFMTFEAQVHMSDGSFNRHAVAAMNASSRMVLSLYKSDPVKMNFYNPKMDIDTKQLGTFTNLMATFTQKRDAPQASRKRSRSPDRSGSGASSSAERSHKSQRTSSGYESRSSSRSPSPSPQRAAPETQFFF